MMNSFQTMEALLKSSYNIGVSTEWLTACLEWIQQENQGVSLSTDDLLSLVYEQWLLSDLSEIGESTLPSDVGNADKVELKSNYPLQLISVVDVGFPLYGQIQKLQGRENPNEEVSADKPFQPAWEPKPSRMLLLQLTDGYTQVKAMEYRPIQNLTGQLPSGTKMLLMGPLICMRGMILLTPGSIQVLGGEVDGLVETNTPLNNLETFMLKNREDEGKHAKTEFSGKFIRRTPGKSDDLLKACIMGEDFDSDEHRLEHKTSQCWAKTELKHNVSQSRVDRSLLGTQSHYSGGLQGHIKVEMKTGHNNCTYQTSHSSDLNNAVMSNSGRSKAETRSALTRTAEIELSTSSNDPQWDNDMDYSELFDDDMDFEHTESSDVAAKGVNRVHKSSERPTGSIVKNSNKPPEPPAGSIMKNPKSGPTCGHSDLHVQQAHTKNSWPDQDDLFEDDYEIIESNFSASTLTNKNTNKTVDNNFPFLSKKNHKTLSTPDKQNICQTATDNSSNQSSPTIPFQNEGMLSFLPGSETSKSPSVLLKKAPLFKAKSTTPSGASNQPKIQSFLSNMSGSKSQISKKGKTSSSSNTIVIDDDTHSSPTTVNIERLNEPFTMKKPTHDNSEKRLSGVMSDDSLSEKRLLTYGESDSSTNSKTKVHSEICKNPFSTAKENSLPKAIIHPFEDFNDIKVNFSEDLPYKYLADIKKLQPPALITVKAYISTLIDKLGSDGGAQWTLACRVNDGTASVDVELSNSVLTKLIGFTAKESLVMRQKAKEDPQVKSALMKGLSKCQQKLINISCLMDLEMLSLSRRPMVTKLTHLSKEHVIQLMQRVQAHLPLNA